MLGLRNRWETLMAKRIRKHCARLNLPTSEWTHYFFQGLKQEIREYVILQQPEL